MKEFLKLNHTIDWSNIIRFQNAIVHKTKNRRIKIFPNIEDNLYLIEIIRLLTKDEIENFKKDKNFKNNYNFGIYREKIMVTRLRLNQETFDFLLNTMLLTKTK